MVSANNLSLRQNDGSVFSKRLFYDQISKIPIKTILSIINLYALSIKHLIKLAYVNL